MQPTTLNAPKLLDHAMVVYDRMTEDAKMTEHGLLYEGFLTRLFGELELNPAYYTQIMNMLKVMECVYQVKRGGGGAPSRWLLLRPPTQEHYEFGQKSGSLKQDKKSQNERAMAQQYADLNNRLLKIEEALGLA